MIDISKPILRQFALDKIQELQSIGQAELGMNDQELRALADKFQEIARQPEDYETYAKTLELRFINQQTGLVDVNKFLGNLEQHSRQLKMGQENRLDHMDHPDYHDHNGQRLCCTIVPK
jgi:hypothetical protein